MRHTSFIFLLGALGVLILWFTLTGGADPLPSTVGTQSDQIEGQPPAPAVPLPTAPAAEPRRVEVPRPIATTEPAPEPADTESVLVGRLVLADGQPVRDAVCASYIQRDHEHSYAETKTDRDGRFRLRFSEELEGSVRVLTMRSKTADRVHGTWTRGRIALAPSYPPGDSDIGDVVVAELPLLVGGRVTDQTGEGVPGVAVYAMPRDLQLEEMRNRRLPETLRCETDAGGRFRICGRVDPAVPYIVVGKRAGLFPVSIPVLRRGATDVVLEMAKAGSLAGSVSLTPNFDPRHIYIELRGDPVAGHTGASGQPILSTTRPMPEGGAIHLTLDESGDFGTDLLRPGTLQCQVRVHGRESPLFEVADVRIEAGPSTRDARLQGIDLSGLRSVILSFADATTREAICSIPVGTREAGQRGWSRRIVTSDGRLLVTTTTGAFDVLAQQRGYRRVLLTDVTADGTVALEPGIEVRATVRLEQALVPGFEMALRLVGVEAREHGHNSIEVPRSASVVVRDGETVTLTVPTPGRYIPVVRVQAVGGALDERMDASGALRAEIEVPATGIPDPLTVEIDGRETYRTCVVIRTLFPQRMPILPSNEPDK